jgi:hypothetical protein
VLNFVFWILVALNALLFAYDHGYLGNTSGNEHEPARMRNQLATDKIQLVAPAEAQSLAAAAKEEAPADAPAPAAPVTPAAETPAPAATAAPQPLVACTEVGSFGAAEARRFETRLARLDLGDRQSRQAVQAQDVTSYLVYVPPQPSKEAADRKVAELRELGVENLFILSGDSPYKWAISLGVFKSEASAQTMLASLNKQGVHGARIAPRGPMATRFVYQFRNLDAATRSKIAGYAERFDAAQVGACR